MRTHRQIRADLLREAMTATAQAHAAAAALSAIMEDIPSRMPHPDGSQRIQNAAHALAAARNQMMEAHSRLDQFLALGVVPGDSKPDTPA